MNNSSEQVIPKKNRFNQNVKTHSEISFTFSLIKSRPACTLVKMNVMEIKCVPNTTSTRLYSPKEQEPVKKQLLTRIDAAIQLDIFYAPFTSQDRG